ncbi:response regulator transcription factor [Flavobacteriaceae bacterium TP-CH-4]|uniref:Response regulator transcription factor n=1 Tax=Pelagihabitans pacificus TaxID=2696054 RepID=A0A967E8R7_9FLAO|nr:LytTR family DNA-binding domain-containing protein [Pelagihabitans pacificus]NHF57811.1 response regulator transcription factor [Pelagihabitans pacificus]
MKSTKKLHILLLEDEIPAFQKLIAYLTDFFGEAFSHEHVRTVKEGITLLRGMTNYDLILSDIKLLDGTSFEIFHQIETKTPIIFCTAYDEHLLEAFQTNGIAYILKPYSRRDFDRALQKFKDLFEPQSLTSEIFEQLRNVLDTKEERYKKRFAIKKKEGIKLLETVTISLIQAQGDFCQIIDHDGKLHSISKNIGTLVSELDPKTFFRINRSQLVHILHIEQIAPYSKNRLALKMKGAKEHAITSSSVTKEFRAWLEQ